MPAIAAVPWLIPLLTATAAAGTIGDTIYNIVDKPSTGPTDAQKTQLASEQKLAQQKAAFLNSQQGNTNPTSGTGLTSTPGLSTPSSGQPDLGALMKQLGGGGSTPSNLSGGTGSSTPTPANPNGLTDLNLA